jgi:hypothetical protein
MAIDWVIVKDRDFRTPIGALGFIGDEIVVVTAFYADKDWNHDGKVDLKERFLSIFGMKGKALFEVASRAYDDPDIAIRDPTIRQWQGRLLTTFAAGMIIEGVYKSYMAFGISQAASAVAAKITQNMIMAVVVKKGMEKAVELAFKESMEVR